MRKPTLHHPTRFIAAGRGGLAVALLLLLAGSAGAQADGHSHGASPAPEGAEALPDAELHLEEWERAAWERQQGVWRGLLTTFDAEGNEVDRRVMQREMAIDFETNAVALRITQPPSTSDEPAAGPSAKPRDYTGQFEGNVLVFKAMGLSVRAWAVSDAIVVYHWVRPARAETVVETISTYGVGRRGRTLQQWRLGELKKVSVAFDDSRLEGATLTVDARGDNQL